MNLHFELARRQLDGLQQLLRIHIKGASIAQGPCENHCTRRAQTEQTNLSARGSSLYARIYAVDMPTWLLSANWPPFRSGWRSRAFQRPRRLLPWCLKAGENEGGCCRAPVTEGLPPDEIEPRPDLFNLISFFLLFSANSFAFADSAFCLPENPGRGVDGVLR